MIEEAIGKIIGMAMAYIVSSLGLLFAYYNYRKRIVKAERVFTPAAAAIIVVVVAITAAGTIWLLVRKPVASYACLCVDVVNKDGAPLQGALVYAEGVSYEGNFERVRTNASGRACITVKNSLLAPNTVNVFAKVRNTIAAYPLNPVTTPTEMASCILKMDCPAKCVVLPRALQLEVPEVKWDPAQFSDLKYEEKIRTETKLLGVVFPIAIFIFSFAVTWILYRHFTRKIEEEKSGQSSSGEGQ
jgi:hypothetical protein